MLRKLNNINSCILDAIFLVMHFYYFSKDAYSKRNAIKWINYLLKYKLFLRMHERRYNFLYAFIR